MQTCSTLNSITNLNALSQSNSSQTILGPHKGGFKKMEKLKNNKFRVRIWIQGVRQSKVFSRQTDAKAWKQQKMLEKERIEAFGAPSISEISFEDFAKLWLERKKNLSERTFENYQVGINNYLNPLFCKCKLKHLRLNDAQTLLAKLHSTNLGVTRKNFYIRLLKNVFSDAEKWEYIQNNPFKHLEKLKEPQREVAYWLPEEVKQFLNANLDHEFLALFVVALNTGLRRGELLGLKWEKVDFINRQIIVSHTRTRYGLKPSTKTGRIRYVPMNDTVVRTLENLRLESRPSDLVFVNRNGIEPNLEHLSHRFFLKAIKKAGVKKIRFHDLRGTFSANFCMAGGDIYALSKILGHTKVDMTSQKYAHLHPTYLKNCVEIVQFDVTES